MSALDEIFSSDRPSTTTMEKHDAKINRDIQHLAAEFRDTVSGYVLDQAMGGQDGEYGTDSQV